MSAELRKNRLTFIHAPILAEIVARLKAGEPALAQYLGGKQACFPRTVVSPGFAAYRPRRSTSRPESAGSNIARTRFLESDATGLRANRRAIPRLSGAARRVRAMRCRPHPERSESKRYTSPPRSVPA